MEIFKTSDVYQYLDEKERREKIYKKLCQEAQPNDSSLLAERIKRLDEAYLDWHDRVILEN